MSSLVAGHRQLATIRRVSLSITAGHENTVRTVRHKLKYHPYHLDTWQSTTVRFRRNFLPRTTELWNGLPAAVFPGRYDMGSFKKRVYLHLKGRQRTCNSSGAARCRVRR